MTTATNPAGQQAEESQGFPNNQTPVHAASHHLMDGYTLKGISRRNLSTPTPTFTSDFGKRELRKVLGPRTSSKKFFEALSRIASQLKLIEIGRYREQGFYRDLKFPVQQLKIGKNSCTLIYEASGHYGLVFKLKTEQGHQYALKIFYQGHDDYSLSGPWSEAALGFFITAKRVHDMPHLLAADPEEGWMLSEFVDHSYQNSTPDGPSWKELGLTSLDCVKDKSNIIVTDEDEHIRVDYGHLDSPERICWKPGPEMQELAKLTRKQGHLTAAQFLNVFRGTPEARPALFEKLRHIKKTERFEVLRQMLNYPEARFFPLQNYLTMQVFPVTMTRALFDLWMEQKDPLWRGQAIFNISQLSKEDANYLGRIWTTLPEFKPFMFYLERIDLSQALATETIH